MEALVDEAHLLTDGAPAEDVTAYVSTALPRRIRHAYPPECLSGRPTPAPVDATTESSGAAPSGYARVSAPPTRHTDPDDAGPRSAYAQDLAT